MRSALFLIIIGLGGAAILISLGIWQVQRLEWKQGVIATIEARIDGDPQILPAIVDPETDAYLPVHVLGLFEGPYLRVLVSDKERGAGYRIIAAMQRVDKHYSRDPAKRIMVDLGFVRADQPDLSVGTQAPVLVQGNLQWPQETDGFTPAPDVANNIWYARDVPTMADALGTQPVLVVARSKNRSPQIQAMPVDTARIPNNHLQYAITWFSLAAIWLAMSLYFVRRRKA